MSSQVLLYGMRPTLRRVFVVMVATMCSLATAVTVTPSDGVPDWERHGMYGDANRGECVIRPCPTVQRKTEPSS